MLLGWSWRAVWTRRAKNETLVIGTDPPLSVLVAIPWRLFRPRARIVHWCHDLYPQAAIAEGILKSDSWSVRLLNALLRVAGELRAFAAEPERIKAMREHCFQVYHREFSKRVQLGKWKKVLEIGDF